MSEEREHVVGFVRSFLTTMELSTYLTMKEKLTLFGKSTIRKCSYYIPYHIQITKGPTYNEQFNSYKFANF